MQKATELGVAACIPVLTERTNAARVNLDRLSAIAVEAAEQCERLTIPAIAAAAPPRRPAGQLAAERALVVAAGARRCAAGPAIRPTPAALLVGPEGGFAPAELDALRRHPFVQPSTLGPRILRAETAAIVGLALLQAHSGG